MTFSSFLNSDDEEWRDIKQTAAGMMSLAFSQVFHRSRSLKQTIIFFLLKRHNKLKLRNFVVVHDFMAKHGLISK